MAKKEDMKKGIENLLAGGPKPKPVPRERQVTDEADATISAQERERRSRTGRRRTDDTRPRATQAYNYTSLALDLDLYEKIRQIAIRNGLPYRDIVNAAMKLYIDRYEAKNGVIETSRESRISAMDLV